MKNSGGSVAYGKENIQFSLFFADRKTLEIAVYPDTRVVVKAPLGTAYEEIIKRVGKRGGWITRQMAYFRQFDPRTPARKYIGGETHLYLGRRYRLKISSGNLDEVKLTGGYFRITIKGNISPHKIKSLLESWYEAKAASKFNECFDRCWLYFATNSLPKPRLHIQHMQKRWGSLSKHGRLTLNTDLVRAPGECIDYVVLHELAHLQYNHHGPEFYRLLEKVMPDWEKRKHQLELALV